MDQPDLGQMPAFLSDKLPIPSASVDEDDAKPAPKRRGRPPKAKAGEEASTDGESEDAKPAPKRRGRPPKAKASEDGEGSDDLSDAA